MPGTITQSKKIIAALLAFAVLAFLPVGQACAAAKSYKDAKHGFSFSYPETWANLEVFTDGVMVLAPPEDGVTASFAVNASPPLELAEMTAEVFTEAYEMIMDDVEILSYKTTKLGGAPCIFIDLLCTIGKQQLRGRQQIYMANHRGKGYTLVFSTRVKDYGKCEDSLKMMLDSFRF